MIGASYSSIIRIVWPIALGMINNAVMQFVDRIFLARLSMSALEAALPASTLGGVIVCFFQSVIGYSGVFVSQYYGAGEIERCRKCCRVALWLSFAFGLLMPLFLPIGALIFDKTATSVELANLEYAYFSICTLGSAFLFAQSAISSYFTGRGYTRIIFFVNLAGNILNIALDPLLIFTFDLGIAGAAYATVFSQFVQFIVLAVLLKRFIRVRPGTTFPVSGEHWQLIKRLLVFGIPAGGYEMMNLLSFTIFVFITGTMDNVAFAASNACFTINYLIFAPMIGFSIGAQTLVGKYMGANDPDGAAVSLHRTLKLCLAFSLACVVLLLLLRNPILALFAPDDPALAESFNALGVQLIMLMSAWIVFDAIDTVLGGALKGAGDTRFVFWWMMFNAFVIWLPLVALVKLKGGSMCWLWSTMIVYVVSISIGSLIRWHRGKWRSIKMISENATPKI